MGGCPCVLLLFGFAGHWEILVIGGVALLLFFGRRIPEVLRSLGRGVTQFKKGLHDTEDGTEGEVATGEEAFPALGKEGKDVGVEREKTASAPSKRSLD